MPIHRHIQKNMGVMFMLGPLIRTIDRMAMEKCINRMDHCSLAIFYMARQREEELSSSKMDPFIMEIL